MIKYFYTNAVELSKKISLLYPGVKVAPLTVELLDIEPRRRWWQGGQGLTLAGTDNLVMTVRGS